MSIERIIFAFAGGAILITLLLSVVFSNYWLIATAFVGANLLQAAFTGFCPMARILEKMGVESKGVF